MKFEAALREQLERNRATGRKATRIYAILDSRPSRRRTKRISRMEKASKEALGLRGAVDWADVDAAGDIDWKSVLSMLVEFLLKLLPLIFASEDEDVDG